MYKRFMTAAAALLVGTSALAHGGAEHARGTVKSATADVIVVSTEHGTRSFRVTARTSVVKDGAPSAMSELHEGDRVVIHAAHAASLEADRIVASGVKGRSGVP